MRSLKSVIESVKDEAGMAGLTTNEKKILRKLWDDNGTTNVLVALGTVLNDVKHTKFVGDKDFARESDRQIQIIKKAIQAIG